MRTPPQNPVILIPARMASTRLPNKPLADIAGYPMIVQVWRRGQEARLGEVIVACAEKEIKAAIEAAGGRAILTDPNHPSGSDRIYEALTKIDPDKKFDAVINLQGDLPTIDPHAIQAAYSLLQNPETDIGTLGVKITDTNEYENPNIVKIVNKDTQIDFVRTVRPEHTEPFYHHIGIYTYRRDALEKFVNTPPSEREKNEKLEQLRALALGMRIDAAIIETVPLGVDTPEDLEHARQILS